MFPSIRRYLGAEDFTSGICRQVAERLFADLEAGRPPDPGGYIAMYTDEEEQRAASALFVRDIGIKGSERSKALKDLAVSVKKASIDRQSAIADLNALALKEGRLLRRLADEKKRYCDFIINTLQTDDKKGL